MRCSSSIVKSNTEHTSTYTPGDLEKSLRFYPVSTLSSIIFYQQKLEVNRHTKQWTGLVFLVLQLQLVSEKSEIGAASWAYNLGRPSIFLKLETQTSGQVVTF